MTVLEKHLVTKMLIKSTKGYLPNEPYNQMVQQRNRTYSAYQKRYPVSSTIYINTLSRPITVVESTGKRFSVAPATHGTYRGKFVVRQNLQIDYEEHARMLNYMRARSRSNEAEVFYLDVVAKSLDAPPYANNPIHREMFEDYVICTEEDFDYKPGFMVEEIFHLPTGIFVSTKSLEGASKNPTEPTATDRDRLDLLEEKRRVVGEDVINRIELVVRGKRLSSRYINIGGIIHTLSPKDDPDRPEGVYYTYNKSHHDSPHILDLVVEYCKLEDAEKTFGIYRTVDEAETHGFIEDKNRKKVEIQEQEILRLKHDNQRLSNDVSNLKSSFKIDMEHLENTNKNLNAKLDNSQTVINTLSEQLGHLREQHKRDQEAALEDRKFRYENRSQDRKDTSEILKIISGLLIGVAGLWAIFKKFK